jgi:hypothetical protein
MSAMTLYAMQHVDPNGALVCNWLTRADSPDGVRAKAISILQGERNLDWNSAALCIDQVIADGSHKIVTVEGEFPPYITGLAI